MNFNVLPSLAFSSSVAVTVGLYYHEDLLSFKSSKCWSPIEKRVAMCVPTLTLPQKLKENILELVQPVGEQILMWLARHENIVKGDVKAFKKLSWTPLGLIDYRKTADNLILSREMDNYSAFELACYNSLEDHIIRLWAELESQLLPEFNLRLKNKVKRCSDFLPPLELGLWVAHLSNQTRKFAIANNFGQTDFFTYALELAVSTNNVGSAAYFINKLVAEEKAEIVAKAAQSVLPRLRRRHNAAIFLLLLSHMDPVQQNNFFLSFTTEVLSYFLVWPLQQFFLSMLDKMWNANFLVTHYSAITLRIAGKIMAAEVPLMYEQIFKEFWLRSPANYKNGFIQEWVLYHFKRLFFPHRLESVMKILFKIPNAEEKLHQLIFSNGNAALCFVVNENKFEAFKNLVEKYFTSEDIINNFEEVYSKYTRRYLDEYYDIHSP